MGRGLRSRRSPWTCLRPGTGLRSNFLFMRSCRNCWPPACRWAAIELTLTSETSCRIDLTLGTSGQEIAPEFRRPAASGCRGHFPAQREAVCCAADRLLRRTRPGGDPLRGRTAAGRHRRPPRRGAGRTALGRDAGTALAAARRLDPARSCAPRRLSTRPTCSHARPICAGFTAARCEDVYARPLWARLPHRDPRERRTSAVSWSWRAARPFATAVWRSWTKAAYWRGDGDAAPRPERMLGLCASLIPFLEHDEPCRALMGANMMRQWMHALGPEACPRGHRQRARRS